MFSLAFISVFCNAEYVRKYLLAISFLPLFYFFTFANAGSASAATVQCHCVNPGIPGVDITGNPNGQNQILCDNVPAKYKNYQFYCHTGETEHLDTCDDDPTATMQGVGIMPNQNIVKDNVQTLPGLTFKGVQCTKADVHCTCDNPGMSGDGNNEFHCYVEGDPNEYGKTWCAGGIPCWDDPGHTQIGGTNNQVGIIAQNVWMKDITCSQNDPNQPPPPSPPCAIWSGGGQCEDFSSAIGNIATQPEGFIQSIFAILLSVSGGIALLLIIKAGYQLMTSQGNPEHIKNGRDQLIAAIVGLIFLIFSFVFLQLIGFDILNIPGFVPGNGGGGGTTCAPGSCIPMNICTAKNPGQCNTNGCPAGQACVQ
jgi:Type IV secretion system pilin